MIARCFIALEVDRAALEAAREAQNLFDGDLVRKVPADSLHVTVKFLGDVSVEDLARPLFERLAPLVTTTPPPALGDGRVEGFPTLGRASVIVLSCADPAMRLAGLAARAEEAAASLGIARETRPYHPHITLARSKDFDARKLAKRFAPRPLGCATRLTLFESHNSRYTQLASASYSVGRDAKARS